MALHVIILAAGQGTRMRSEIPKIMHQIAGTPMLERVVTTAKALNPTAIHVIIGHNFKIIQNAFSHLPVNWVKQTEQLGTGHAVHQAMPNILPSDHVLILSADVPLISTSTLHNLIQPFSKAPTDALHILSAYFDNPFGLGRVIRNNNNLVTAIIEERDANETQRQIKEIYSGICFTLSENLQKWLPKIDNNNAQKEYYLTDIVKLAVNENTPVIPFTTQDIWEIYGVNDRVQLEKLERHLQKIQAQQLMLSGVTIADIQRIDVRGELICDRDVSIDVNTIFIGKVQIGKNCIVESNCILKNAIIGDNCHIHANSIIEDSTIAADCHIGPFARLRPGTKLEDSCKIGNFVETKNSHFHTASKASHLSYIGDATIGKNVNIGAGTITCNYDGANKHHTTIEDNAFIGSGTQLVAPVTIGENATIGAGSTIRKNAEADTLTLSVKTQKTVTSWKRPEKK